MEERKNVKSVNYHSKPKNLKLVIFGFKQTMYTENMHE